LNCIPVAALLVCFLDIRFGTIRPRPVDSIFTSYKTHISTSSMSLKRGKYQKKEACLELTVMTKRAERAPDKTIDFG